MARKKPDYGRLLEKFGDGKRRPALRGRKAIALPTLAELERIDAAAERAVPASRIAVDASNVADATGETSIGVDAADGPLGDAGQAPPPGGIESRQIEGR